MNARLLFIMLFGAAALGSPGAARAGAQDLVQSECSGCHQLEGPSGDLEERMKRTAPPLFYAGNKFREEWLVEWLQKPERIRPAGDFAVAYVVSSADGDMPDINSLVEHPVLEAEQAAEVAAYLMTLRPKDDLIGAEDYTPGRVPERIGAMDFVKFKGCGACHKDTPKYGGLSGPELYSAWNRLQPEFIVSYIRNPVAWEEHSIMPVKHLQTEQIHKLANYLRTIGEKGQ